MNISSESRRRFLRETVVFAGGAASALWWAGYRSTAGAADAADAETDSPESRAQKLKLEIPAPGAAAGLIVPAVRSGSLLFVSGHTPKTVDGKPIVGKVGHDMDVKQAADAARQVALTILGVVRKELGSLNRVSRVVKVLGMVNCTPDFTASPQVINGFSQVLIDVFGETAGRGARSAVGMVSLPGGVAVEVEAIFEIRN